MEKIIVKRGQYCLSEKALSYLHGNLYKYYASNKELVFYNGNQVVNIGNVNDYLVLVRVYGNENDLRKRYIFSKVDLGDEYIILNRGINLNNILFTNQYGKNDLYNKKIIDAIKKLGPEAADNGCIFEIIKEQYRCRRFNFGNDEKKERQKELRRQYLIKNCETDKRCKKELYRDFGIVIHPS